MGYDHRQGGHRFGFIHRLPSMFGNSSQLAATSTQTTTSVSVNTSLHRNEDIAECNGRRESCSQFPFMSLPIEVRLQIYQYVYEMTPIHSISESMPWYPVPSLRPYPTREIQAPTPTTDVENNMRRNSHSTIHSNDASEYILMPLSTTSSHSTTSESNSDTFSTTSPLSRKSSTSTWSAYDSESPSSTSKAQPYISHHHSSYNHPVPLLPPDRPYAKLPTSLLRTSRTIYHECRTIPFHSNEFVFPTWFASGVHSAGTLMQKLNTWQTSSLRWTRIELLSRDLETVSIPRGSRLSTHVDACDVGPVVSGGDGGRAGDGEDDERELVHMTDFLRLCAVWSQGIRGLRIKIMAAERVWFGAPWDTASGFGMMDFGYAANGPIAAQGQADGGQQQAGEVNGVKEGPKGIITVRDERGRARPWVSKGLAAMEGLRQLEVELCPTAPLVTAAAALAMAEVSQNASDLEKEEKAAVERKETMLKLRWCVDLEDAINEIRGRGEEHVRVICVSKVLFTK